MSSMLQFKLTFASMEAEVQMKQRLPGLVSPAVFISLKLCVISLATGIGPDHPGSSDVCKRV